MTVVGSPDNQFDVVALRSHTEFFFHCMEDKGKGANAGNPDAAVARALSRLAMGRMHLLKMTIGEEEKVVSLCGVPRQTASVTALAPVVTLPENANRGFATQLVAEVTQKMLNRGGEQFVVLFTDTANPHSNYIYAKIGFKPVFDFVEYTR